MQCLTAIVSERRTESQNERESRQSRDKASAVNAVGGYAMVTMGPLWPK